MRKEFLQSPSENPYPGMNAANPCGASHDAHNLTLAPAPLYIGALAYENGLLLADLTASKQAAEFLA